MSAPVEPTTLAKFLAQGKPSEMTLEEIADELRRLDEEDPSRLWRNHDWSALAHQIVGQETP